MTERQGHRRGTRRPAIAVEPSGEPSSRRVAGGGSTAFAIPAFFDGKGGVGRGGLDRRRVPPVAATSRPGAGALAGAAARRHRVRGTARAADDRQYNQPGPAGRLTAEPDRQRAQGQHHRVRPRRIAPANPRIRPARPWFAPLPRGRPCNGGRCPREVTGSSPEPARFPGSPPRGARTPERSSRHNPWPGR